MSRTCYGSACRRGWVWLQRMLRVWSIVTSKPANILLETNVDRVLLTDFGLARAVDDATLTRTGIIAGTPQYMSPEQANGDSVDPRSDLFSLGGVLYAMCTGRPPF